MVTPPLRWLRLLRCGLHLLWGAATVFLVFPWVSPSLRLEIKGRWSRQLLAILGVRLDASLAAMVPGSLIVANHISWLDVFVFNAARPMAFVVKADVRGWPLIGWLVAHTGNVFLRRGSRGHAKTVNGEIVSRLAAGEIVTIFPEGTTSDGDRVLAFHAALLQPALDARRPIQPLAISYRDATGGRSTAPAYAGETSLWQSLRAIVAARGLTASVAMPPALAPEINLEMDPDRPGTGESKKARRELAQTARGAIAAAIGAAVDIPAAIHTDTPDGAQ